MAPQLHAALQQIVVSDTRGDIHWRGPLGYDAVYAHAEKTVGQWVATVKRSTGMAALRASVREESRPVTKIGVAWGGMRLFVNLSYPMKLIELRAELIIAGETDLRVAVHAGIRC